MKVNFNLRKPDKNNIHTVFLTTTINGVRLFYNTRIKARREEWDANKQRFKGKDRQAANAKLGEFETLAFRFADMLPLENPAPSQKMLNAFLDLQLGRATAESKMNFLKFAEKVCRDSAKRINSDGEIISAKTQFKYWLTHRLLAEFQKYKRKSDRYFGLDFDTVGKSIEELKYFLTKVKGYAPSTINKHLKTVRTFITEAEKGGYRCPCDLKALRVKGDKVEHTILTDEELQRIVDLDLSGSPSLDNCKCYFLISAYTGLRYSDAIRLDRSNINEGVITIHQQKTGNPVQIPVHPTIQGIVERIGELHPISNAKYNKYIKTVAMLAGIDTVVEVRKTVGGERVIEKFPKWQLVSSHTARRQFCSTLYAKGLNEWVIMSFSGHKDLTSFKQYICLSADAKMDMLKSVWERGK